MGLVVDNVRLPLAAFYWYLIRPIDFQLCVRGVYTRFAIVQALTKTWRFGQQMRRYFDYGDVRDAVDSQMEKQRQQVKTGGHQE